ncbi:rhomboid family intramembrane serine protease [Skermanella pratensis]|uniref:rhomboid family intramembrane serine protease n=1 Tax=Skermanella pratensis TaxID=2233999 RepID=UPI0017888DEE|nr:rhomboid family intramembrane serine protease [Skermanella pratensis]
MRPPYATVSIVVLCILSFMVQGVLAAPAAWNFVLGFSMIPAVVTGARLLPPDVPSLGGAFSLLSSMFLHADIWHLAGNMLFLWLFGDSIEFALGHVRYGLFYLLCGLGGAGAEILHDPGSLDPVVGASGAISGLLAAAVMLHPRGWLTLVLPRRRIRLPVPVYVALGGWLGIQGVEAMAGDLEALVAWWSHLGGFVTGMILILPFRRFRGRFGAWR